MKMLEYDALVLREMIDVLFRLSVADEAIRVKYNNEWIVIFLK